MSDARSRAQKTGAACGGCGETIASTEKLYTVNLFGALSFDFHAECYESWHTFKTKNRQSSATKTRVGLETLQHLPLFATCRGCFAAPAGRAMRVCVVAAVRTSTRRIWRRLLNHLIRRSSSDGGIIRPIAVPSGR